MWGAGIGVVGEWRREKGDSGGKRISLAANRCERKSHALGFGHREQEVPNWLLNFQEGPGLETRHGVHQSVSGEGALGARCESEDGSSLGPSWRNKHSQAICTTGPWDLLDWMLAGPKGTSVLAVAHGCRQGLCVLCHLNQTAPARCHGEL